MQLDNFSQQQIYLVIFINLQYYETMSHVLKPKSKEEVLHASCRSVLGYSLGTTRKERPESLRETAELVFGLLETGKLQIHIGKTFPLHEAALAHEWVESRQSTGKVLLSV
jgi:NADPH:quinone reductase-like Zn-dependent oxidoreductase